MERSILHMDLDTFFVSCERLMDSRLEGLPILVGGTGDRGVVSAASYEARPYGVHSGMPMRMARQLCPEAVVIRGNGGTYTKYSRMVTEILRERVPVLEKASVDEFYADMTGMDRFFGNYKYAGELRDTIMRETGLPISFGLSVNKTVSKVATNEAKPNSQIHIDYGQEKLFLAPLSVKKIPMIGVKTYQKLCNLGLKRVHHVQQMPLEAMEGAMGKNGRMIWTKSQGIDHSPIKEYHERKSISSERTYGRDTIDIQLLRTTLTAMTENLAYKLRRAGKVAACVTVKIRYSDFNTYTKQKKIGYTAADHVLIPKVMEIFDQLYDKRLLIRLIGVRLSDITQGTYQLHLFDDSMRQLQLYEAMDAIRDRYGGRSIMRASGLGARTIGDRDDPFDGEPPIVLAHRTQ